MLKSKKKLLPIVSFLVGLVALCLGSVSLTDVSADAATEEPAVKQAEMIEFQYFNVYSEDSQNIAIGVAKYGLLLRFDEILSDNRSEINGGIKSVNLIDKYGKNIFLNNMPLDFYTDAEICYFYEDYMWVYVPNMVIYRELSVDQEFRFEDRMIQPFELYTMVNDYGFVQWTDDKQAYLDTQTHTAELRKIEFNNTGYKYFSPLKGLLLEYDQKNDAGEWMNKDLSNTMTEKDGRLMKMNLINHNAIRNEILGEGAGVGENILLDGTPIQEIPDAEISYHSQRYLWLYVPNMIEYSKLEIKDNTLFFDTFLTGTVLYSNGTEWVDFDPNASRAETTGTESVTYDKIEWNNFDYGYRDNKNGVLIKFSDHLSKLQREIEGSVRNVNKVSQSIGERVRLNGKPLQNIDGAEISYHSEQLLWVYIPSEYLVTSGGNFPCLTIDADTEFLNAILPEVTLYFDGSYWVEEMPNMANYANNAFSKITYNNLTAGTNEGYVYTVLSFEDDFLDETCRPNFAQTGDAGRKITVNGKTLNELYVADQNTKCTFGEYGKNDVTIVLRKSDLHPTAEYPVTTLTIASGTQFVDKTIGAITLYLVDGKWEAVSAPSTPVGEDKEAPYIYYYGEESYLVITGEEVIDFASKTFAFDGNDGKVECVIEIPEGAVTDGKWNHGEWKVKILATDSEGNKAEKIVAVTVIDKEERYLSIYVNGFFSCRVSYGEKIDITKSEELIKGAPEKPDTPTSYFVFTGWTFDDRLWDFETDVVTEDVWLSPMYREYKRLFTVSITDTVSGNVDFLTLKYGDSVDFSNYEKEGYTLVAKVDDMLVKSITVNGNMSIELQYIPIESDNGGSKAIATMIAVWVGSAVLSAAGIVFYKKLSKKGGKEE